MYLRVLLLVSLLAGVVTWAQTRTDTFDAAAVTVTAMQVWPLPDGGCAARACGYATSADGGVTEGAP